MGTRHELIKDLESDPNFYSLFKKGIISLQLLDKKCYYERYLHELKTYKKSQALANSAEEYNVSEMTIRRAIKFMES